MHWWFKHQFIPLGYILEIVPPLVDNRKNVVAKGQNLFQILRSPVVLDAKGVGSYVHLTHWIWTNLVSHHLPFIALAQISMTTVLRYWCTRMIQCLLPWSTNWGKFPTFNINLGSCAIWAQTPCMVWDANTCTYEEPNVDEQKNAMGFPTQSAVSHNIYKGQHRLLLGWSTWMIDWWLCGLNTKVKGKNHYKSIHTIGT